MCRHIYACGRSRRPLEVSALVVEAAVAVHVAAAEGGPRPGARAVRVAVAGDQGVHAARPVDRHAPRPAHCRVQVDAEALRAAAVRQRDAQLFPGAQLRVRLRPALAAAHEHERHDALRKKSGCIILY